MSIDFKYYDTWPLFSHVRPIFRLQYYVIVIYINIWSYQGMPSLPWGENLVTRNPPPPPPTRYGTLWHCIKYRLEDAAVRWDNWYPHSYHWTTWRILSHGTNYAFIHKRRPNTLYFTFILLETLSIVQLTINDMCNDRMRVRFQPRLGLIKRLYY